MVDKKHFFSCSGCRAQLDIKGESYFYICPYCNITNYIEINRTISTWEVELQVEEKQLSRIINKFLKKIDAGELQSISETKLYYIPFWLIEKNGEKYSLIANVFLPGLDSDYNITKEFVKKPISKEEALEKFIEPEISLEHVMNFFELNEKIQENSNIMLLYYPFWNINYLYEGRQYNIIIDGVTGEEIAHQWPYVSWFKLNIISGMIIALTILIFLFISIFIDSFLLSLFLIIITGTILGYILHKTIRSVKYAKGKDIKV